MKTRWDLFCELRSLDVWCLRNRSKVTVLLVLVVLVASLAMRVFLGPGQ